MFQAKPRIKYAVFFFSAVTCALIASPGDDEVEAYLRDSAMGQLLEVQLEARLVQADSDEERADVAQSLSELYLTQIRELETQDPYRLVVIARAQSLVLRMPMVDLYELRLELLAEEFMKHENAIELHQLRLLSEHSRVEALQSYQEIQAELNRLLAKAMPELELMNRRRTTSRSSQKRSQAEAETEILRKVTSFGQYYLGWAGYGTAVLEERYTDRDTMRAFGWLLGLEGDTPQSKDLGLAATEYDHVSRAAIGVALCHAQSGKYGIAEAWLESLLEQSGISDEVRHVAQLKLTRVHTLQREWYKALIETDVYMKQLGGGAFPVSDSRFIALQVLDSGQAEQDKDAQRLIKRCIDQLIEQREIGHIVDIQSRYAGQAFLGDGFVPSYALALAQLERAESGEIQASFDEVITLLTQALESDDVESYPTHRDDCQLKLAYVHIKNQQPDDALRVCEKVLNRSVDEQAIEEASWLGIAAHDLRNARSEKQAGTDLEQAVVAYIKQYPDSVRARQLVMRYATKGFIDQQVAIDTLREVSDNDERSTDAQRLLIQLQYKLLRQSSFQDTAMLRDTRQRIDRFMSQAEWGDLNQENPRSLVSILQIGIDLTLRDSPQDMEVASEYIRIAMSVVNEHSGLDRVIPELLSQRVRTEVLSGDIDTALATVSALASLDAARAEDAKLLVLNSLMQLWDDSPDEKAARQLVEVGVSVIDRVTPLEPDLIGVQQSSLIERVVDASLYLYGLENDRTLLMLASRLSAMILDRGSPSEAGLRRTTEIGNHLLDDEMQLEAWLRLLAAYPLDDERWFEARFRSLEIMLRLDQARAEATYKQFRVLNSTHRIDPWYSKIVQLFEASEHEDTSSEDAP